MEQGKIAKQMIDFQKTTFDNTFNAMISFQEQTEKMVNTIIDQSPWLPGEGKNVINEWVGACKKGRNDFKKFVDENFKKVEEVFASQSGPKTTSKKSRASQSGPKTTSKKSRASQSKPKTTSKKPK